MISFEKFFTIVKGKTPFKWHCELVDDLIAGKWHDSLGLPPATGKTSFIEIWAYSLYRNILEGKRHIPIRLWYVVDRKVIVDAAYEAAKNIANVLTTNSELKEMAEVLTSHFKCNTPLVAARIRGGIDYKEKNAWLTTPNQPCVITSTVDQYGSRALFRGYGVGAGSRGIHASMTTVDSILALDEAHLVQPLKAIADVITANAKDLGVPGLKIIQLSATNATEGSEFTLQDKILLQRLQAKRKIALINANKDKTVAVLVKEATKLKKNNEVVAVICNTVKTARLVFSKLKSGPVETILLNGRIRNFERDALQKEFEWFKAGREKSKPLFVVATQTMEVGADLDFDAMVSECAPLDCLIQRFGRLNRFGNKEVAEGAIVFRTEKKYPVYGAKVEETWNWLVSQFKNSWILKFEDSYKERHLYAQSPHIPKLPDSLIKTLAITKPHVNVGLDSLLHGVRLVNNSDINILWRSEITQELLESNNFDCCRKWMRIAPPNQQEIISVPIGVFFSNTQNSISDTEFDSEPDDISQKNKDDEKYSGLCFRLNGGEIVNFKSLKPGDTIVVPCNFGNHDQYGWDKESTDPVEDVYDINGRWIRLHKTFLPKFTLTPYKNKTTHRLNVSKLINDLKSKLLPLWEKNKDPKIQAKAARIKKNIKKFNPKYFKITPDEQGIYFDTKEVLQKKKEQLLAAHNGLVGNFAKQFAQAIGLKQEFIDILEIAGKNHDLGKADPRFQKTLYHPKTPDPKKLLAKSKNYNPPKTYPKYWRHELQSLAIIKENNIGKELKDRELFEHIVAAHHGWFRMWPPIVDDPNFKQFTINDYQSNNPYFNVCCNYDYSIFQKLNEKYGYWGLAFLETILRLADYSGSSNP